jgi:ankyrin repeat protein
MTKKLLIISAIISFSFIQSTDVSKEPTGDERRERSKKELRFLEAVKNNDQKKVKELLDSGVNINNRNNYEGNNALIISILHLKESDALSMVKLLIDSKININDNNHLGNTSLIIACKANKPAIVKLLLDNGANINLRNKRGKRALDCAIENNNNEIIQLLLHQAAPAPMPQTPAQMPTDKGDSKTDAEKSKE